MKIRNEKPCWMNKKKIKYILNYIKCMIKVEGVERGILYEQQQIFLQIRNENFCKQNVWILKLASSHK